MSDFRFRVEETSDLKKKEKTQKNILPTQNKVKNTKTNCWGSGPTPVARGGCGAKAPPLAECPERGCLQLPWDLLEKSLN